MDAKVLKRVEDLIRLAGSDREEEARTSAYLACKLIRENKLAVSFDTHREEPTEKMEARKYRYIPPEYSNEYMSPGKGICPACSRSFPKGAKIKLRGGIWCHYECIR